MTVLKKIGAVVAGFIVASIIMLVFEWINHFIFPLPVGLDRSNAAVVQAFTASLPWTAYILVFVGWAFGAFEGGCTTAWLAKEKQCGATIALAVILVIAGIIDMLMLGFPLLATALGLLILAIFPFLGRLALNTFEKNKRAKMAGSV